MLNEFKFGRPNEAATLFYPSKAGLESNKNALVLYLECIFKI